MRNSIVMGIGAGIIWVLVAFFDLFGWAGEGFYANVSAVAYILYGPAWAVVLSLLVAFRSRERRIAKGLTFFFTCLMAMGVGLYLL